LTTPPLRFTLLADGASDRSLIPILGWTLAAIADLSRIGIVAQVADLREIAPPARSLSDRLKQALQYFPCDVLFVHRDAEGQPPDWRIEEVRSAASSSGIASSYVPIVPVQMTEAWLLIDEGAIRKAAGNPHGRVALGLPPLSRLEQVADPKGSLHEWLKVASEKSGRRLDQFQRGIGERVQRVSALIEDFTPLRSLPAFARFEATARDVITGLLGR
jgi:hypothetical protein